MADLNTFINIGANTANFVGDITATNLGNVSAIDLNGNANTVLAGDGTWIAQSGGSGNSISNGTSNVTIPTANSNIVINANTSGWIFGADGNLTAPGNISAIGNITASGLLIDTVTGITSNAGNININQITGLGGYLNAFGANFSGDINAANLSLSGNIISDANISGNVNAANISAGNISLSGNIFAYGANIYSVNGLTMEGGNLTMSSITGLGGSISAEGNIIGANLSATSNVSGQNINGGNLSLSGNVISDLNIQQGNISVSGNITSGSELTVVSANITGVMGLTVSGGDIMIPSSMSGGSLSAYGNITGNYFIGNGSQLTGIVTNASNSIANGSSNVSIPTSNGEVVINPYDVTGTNKWRFSSSGTLYMPPLATIVANTSGMSLTTNDTPTAQKITLNDTIGFTPGNIVLSTNGGNYAWTLDQTGGLTAPGNISTIGNVRSGNIIGTYLYGDGSNISNISVGAGNSIINGNTNVSISGANGNITMAVGGNSAATFTTTNVFLTNVRNDTGNVTNVMYYNTSTKELTFGPASGAAYGNTQVGLYLSSGTVATDYLTSGNISATGDISANNVYSLDVVSAAGNVRGSNINTDGGVSAAGNITANGTGTNLVRRAYTISGSNTAVTLDNIQARVGGSPVRLYVNTVSGSLTGAGDTQTLTSGTVAISSWINVPIGTGAANAFAMSGALSSNGDTAILSLIDQAAGTGMWRITGMIANTTGNLYGVTIERLV